MNTGQLECFVQVALNLSFRRAAEELHLSQPTVSKQISSLEAELGGALFVRTTRQVLLTALGESFLHDAQEILRLTYVAEERARRQSSGNDLIIAYSDSNELMRLAPVLDALRKEHEGLHVLLQQGPRDNNVTRLAREQVDVVMGFESKPLATGGIRFTSLIDSGLSCIVRVDSPLASHDSLGVEDVEGLPQVLCLPPSVRRHGSAATSDIPATDASHTIRCSNSSEAYVLVDAGFGYALIPSLYTMPDPFHKVIAWQGRASAAYGLYHRDASRGGVVPDFIRLASEFFGEPAYDRPLPETWNL
ncbi:MAG: LysR family transcriptional regulator [Atopobiaceae bacterium]|nr:LysR family transcriptional regulator [Atopobiaceae bacterium]